MREKVKNKAPGKDYLIRGQVGYKELLEITEGVG